MAFPIEYGISEAELRKAAQDIESDDYTATEVENIGRSVVSGLHQEVGIDAEYATTDKRYKIAKQAVLFGFAGAVLASYSGKSLDAERNKNFYELERDKLKKVGKIHKTSGMNNYA